MEISQKIEEVVKERTQKIKSERPNLIRLQELYLEKVKKGIAIKQKFSLPFIDYKNRSFYHSPPKKLFE